MTTAAAPSPPAPIHIPGFRIERTLGKGGMATVHLAVQESLQRRVALKLMEPGLATDAGFAERFLKEGRVIAQLVHPNIVTVHDVGRCGTSYFIAMEYLPGGDLKQRIRRGLTPDQVMRILRQVASALALAHRRGVVHRDIKPANILFRDADTAVLSDFGIAKVQSFDGDMTAIGWVVGTPDYMSPEQAMGQKVDSRSDLYSLGVVLYQALTGHKPSGAAAAGLPMPEPGRPPQLPPALLVYQPLLDGLLIHDRERRLANADRLLELIDRIVRPATAEVSPDREQTVILGNGGGEKEGYVDSVVEPIRVSASPDGLTATATGAEDATRVKPKSRGPELGLVVAAVLGVGLVAGGYWWFETQRSLTPPVVVQKGEGEERTTAPQPLRRALDPKAQAEIDSLLEVAEVHMSVGRMTEPRGGSALDVYRAVLELDSSNAAALAGIAAIERARSTTAPRR